MVPDDNEPLQLLHAWLQPIDPKPSARLFTQVLLRTALAILSPPWQGMEGLQITGRFAGFRDGVLEIDEGVDRSPRHLQTLKAAPITPKT